MNIKPGNLVKSNQPIFGEVEKFRAGTLFTVKYIFPEAELVAVHEIGQTQLNIIPIDKLELIKKPAKINTKVKYLISPGEAFGDEVSNTIITGTLKAYDNERNIGLIYFGRNKSKSECGCYILVKQDVNSKEVLYVRYSDETWINVEE